MNRAKKVTAVAAVITGLLVSGTTLAKGGFFHQGFGPEGDFMAQQQREFNKDEIAILMQAHILKRGNPNVKLGEVKQTEDGFEATVVTKKEGSLVKTVTLDKSGRPTDGMMGRMGKGGKKGMKPGRRGECRAMMMQGEMPDGSDAEQVAARGNRMAKHRMMMAERFDSDVKLSKDQIKTLVEAKLIRRGNPNVKLGKVTEAGENFEVTIVTQDNALVRTMTLNAAGFPIARN